MFCIVIHFDQAIKNDVITPHDYNALYIRLKLYICLLTLANMLLKKVSSNKKISKKTLHYKNLDLKDIKIVHLVFLGLIFSIESPPKSNQHLDLSQLSKNQKSAHCVIDNISNNANNNDSANNALANVTNLNATLLPNIVITSDQNNNEQNDYQEKVDIIIPRKKSENQNIEYQPCFSPRGREEVNALKQYESQSSQVVNETVNSKDKKFNNQTLNDDEYEESESDDSITSTDYLSSQQKTIQTTSNDSKSNQPDHTKLNGMESQNQTAESEKNTPNSKSTSQEANTTNTSNNNIDTSNNSVIINNNASNNVENDNIDSLKKEHNKEESSNTQKSDKKPFIDIIKRDHIPMHKVREFLKEYSISEILETLQFIKDPYTLERFLALTSIIDPTEDIKLIFNSVLSEECNNRYPKIRSLLPDIFHLNQDTLRQTIDGVLKLKTKDEKGKNHYDYDSILKVLDSLSATFSECFIRKKFDFSSNPEKDKKAYSQFLTKLSHKATESNVFKQTLKKMLAENEARKNQQQQQLKEKAKTFCCC